MRLLLQTAKSYVIVDVSAVEYDKPTDTLIVRDGRTTYRVGILESRSLEFITRLLEEGYVDLSTFMCTEE